MSSVQRNFMLADYESEAELVKEGDAVIKNELF